MHKDYFIAGVFVGVILGIVMASVLLLWNDRTWNQWCIDQGYASYDSKTGVLVYVEKEE